MFSEIGSLLNRMTDERATVAATSISFNRCTNPWSTFPLLCQPLVCATRKHVKEQKLGSLVFPAFCFLNESSQVTCYVCLVVRLHLIKCSSDQGVLWSACLILTIF